MRTCMRARTPPPASAPARTGPACRPPRRRRRPSPARGTPAVGRVSKADGSAVDVPYAPYRPISRPISTYRPLRGRCSIDHERENRHPERTPPSPTISMYNFYIRRPCSLSAVDVPYRARYVEVELQHRGQHIGVIFYIEANISRSNVDLEVEALRGAPPPSAAASAASRRRPRERLSACADSASPAPRRLRFGKNMPASKHACLRPAQSRLHFGRARLQPN
jgi:hypothetical protein